MCKQVRWDNAIVIFDEAHNVEGVCSDASSCDLTAKQLTDALAEAKRCVLMHDVSVCACVQPVLLAGMSVL